MMRNVGQPGQQSLVCLLMLTASILGAYFPAQLGTMYTVTSWLTGTKERCKQLEREKNRASARALGSDLTFQ